LESPKGGGVLLARAVAREFGLDLLVIEPTIFEAGQDAPGLRSGGGPGSDRVQWANGSRFMQPSGKLSLREEQGHDAAKGGQEAWLASRYGRLLALSGDVPPKLGQRVKDEFDVSHDVPSPCRPLRAGRAGGD
jgi:hypothetical protein